MASFRIFFFSVSSTFKGTPPTAISGDAAPACVPGAMAAISAESKNKKSRRCPARAGGRDVDRHRHRRRQDVLDDVFHGYPRPPGVSMVISTRLACCEPPARCRRRCIRP